MATLEEKLIKIGLTKREAAVYVALLELGPTGALQISRKTSINRPMVYSAVEALKKRGLVEVQLQGIKQKFVAANPDQFDSIIRDRKKTFDDALPELLALYNLKGSKSQIKYYEGLEGIKTVYDDTLRSLRTGDPYYIMARQENWEKLEFSWLEKFIERRARKQLDTRIIFEDSERGKLNKKMEQAGNQKVRLMSKPIDTKMIVTPQRYVVHDFSPPITTIVIENENIIKNQLQLFRYIWDTLPE
jgi:HTH-type transcriptional regulator, sugar sensing transcriptional regulator